MANVTITNVDNGAVEIDGAICHDEIVNFAGGATYKKGTILARDTVTDKLIPYVKGGNTNGDGVPRAVLTYELTRSAAGDEYARVLVAGHVNRERLVIHADGDASNVDEVVLDLLRAQAIVCSPVDQLTNIDNPQ